MEEKKKQKGREKERSEKNREGIISLPGAM